MQIGTKFSVAIHILLCADFFKDTHKITSKFLAKGVNTNPVVIRKIMGLLKEAELIDIAQGSGGVTLTRKPSKITLLDIYYAVEPVKDGKLFKVHTDCAPNCPVSSKIENLLSGYFETVQTAMEKKLQSYNLQSILNRITELL